MSKRKRKSKAILKHELSIRLYVPCIKNSIFKTEFYFDCNWDLTVTIRETCLLTEDFHYRLFANCLKRRTVGRYFATVDAFCMQVSTLHEYVAHLGYIFLHKKRRERLENDCIQIKTLKTNVVSRNNNNVCQIKWKYKQASIENVEFTMYNVNVAKQFCMYTMYNVYMKLFGD